VIQAETQLNSAKRKVLDAISSASSSSMRSRC
jgi:hypothetical protein